MSRIPSLPYTKILKALQRIGFEKIRQKGSHIRMQKMLDLELIKIIIPAHNPVKKSTLAHILKQARITPEDFEKLL